jgi:hypothetical protein
VNLGLLEAQHADADRGVHGVLGPLADVSDGVAAHGMTPQLLRVGIAASQNTRFR